MCQTLLWLSILASVSYLGDCYTTNDSEIFPKGVEILRTCNINDLHLESLRNVICFPKRRHDVVYDGATCVIRQRGNVKHATGRNEMTLKQCIHGHWKTASLGTRKRISKRGWFKRALSCVFTWQCGGGGGGGGSPRPPKTPPTFETNPCPPANLQDNYYVASGHTSTVVTWSDPPAKDTDGSVQSVEQILGITKGSQFPGGPDSGRPHVITYKATDNDGLTGTCQFSFNVIIRTCDVATWPTNGQRTCSQKANLGSVCTYSCNQGYELSGTRQVTCQGSSSPSWTSTPTCEKVVCPEPALLENGTIACSNPSYEFETGCSYSCNPNYKLSVPTFYIRCRADRTWTSTQWPTCTDAFPPTLTCLTPQTVYTDRSSNTTSVEWTLPTANDTLDPNPQINQTEGQTLGSMFTAGSSYVKYKAIDNKGNESPECTIEIRVLETVCQHPLDTLNDTNMAFDCIGVTYTYGTECTLTCNYNIPLSGTDRITCERNETSSNLGIGFWSWGNGSRPFCNHTNCPTPDPPENGALTESYVGAIKLVTMFCNANFDIPPVAVGFTGQFVCTNSGTFTPAFKIPDCSEPRHPRYVNLPTKLFYFTGNCNNATTQAEITSNLEQILSTSVNPIIRTLCPDVNNCTTNNLRVICGTTTSRKKRYARSSPAMSRDDLRIAHDRQERQIQPTVTVTAEFDMIVYLDLVTFSVLEAVDAADNLLTNIIVPKLEDLVEQHVFDSGEFTTSSAADSLQTPEYSDIGCDEGFIPVRTSCVPCPPAYFHNATSDQCEICQIGSYSGVAAMTICTACPTGYTTLETGSKSESQCIEMCPAGRYSATGTVPCTPCPVGSYQSGTGQTFCIKCTTGTTELTGSMSSTACQAFHMLINATGGDVTVGSLAVDLTDVTLTVWAKLYSAGTADANIRLTSDGNDRVILHLRDTIRVEIPETQFDKDLGSLSSTSWSHVAVTWNTTTNAIVAYVNGQLHSSETLGSAPPSPLVSDGTIVLQASGNTGLYIADLHVEDTVSSSSEISTLATSCWTERLDAGFSFHDLRDTNFPGVQIQTPLSCDPIDECASNPCNSHTCVNGIDTYTCYCSDGWSGIDCMTPPDYCVDNGCVNDALCVNGNTGYTCSCMTGYSGSSCDIEEVDGGFSEWSSWTDCSVTCDGGTQSRTRSCDNPFPSSNGVNCSGSYTETQTCNTTPCPQCPHLTRGFRGTTSCTVDDMTGVSTCTIVCYGGYVLPSNLADEVYTCGISTNYRWSPKDNAPDCVDSSPPSSYTMQSSSVYDSTIADSDKAAVEQAVTENSADVPCVESGKCTTSVEIQTSERKRSTGSTIIVTFTINITETGDLDIQSYIDTDTASDSLQELIDAINSMENSASFINSSSSSVFDVTVNGVTYSSSQSTLTISGIVTCPAGQTSADGVCASCPEGTYYTQGYCTFCEKGTYSSTTGQTSCTSCPAGYSTSTIGSYNVSQCTVGESSTSVATPIDIHRTQTSQGNTGMYIGIPIGSAVVFALIAIVVGVCYKKVYSRKARRVSSTSDLHQKSLRGTRVNSVVTLSDVDYAVRTSGSGQHMTRRTSSGAADIGNTPFNERYNGANDKAIFNAAHTSEFVRPGLSPPPPYIQY